MQPVRPFPIFHSPSAPSQAQVTLPHALTIAGVAGLKCELAAAQQAGGPVRVSGGSVQEVDTTGLQLLVVARQSAVSAGVEWILTDPTPQLCEHATLTGLAEALTLFR